MSPLAHGTTTHRAQRSATSVDRLFQEEPRNTAHVRKRYLRHCSRVVSNRARVRFEFEIRVFSVSSGFKLTLQVIVVAYFVDRK